jgi:hypothetical protein
VPTASTNSSLGGETACWAFSIVDDFPCVHPDSPTVHISKMPNPALTDRFPHENPRIYAVPPLIFTIQPNSVLLFLKIVAQNGFVVSTNLT